MAEVTAAMVKTLRERTGAGMMACKDALSEANGNEEAAVEIIQKKGLAKVAKKAGAIAADGVIDAYIHAGGRVGVLLEVNCQTDFVARNEEFRAFTQQTAMHIAAEAPEFVREDDIPADKVAQKMSIFRGQLDEEEKASGKARPAAAIEKILEGKLAKWKTESCLVNQKSIVDDEKTVQQQCDELSAKIGEKVSIRRFVRYELGEGIEKPKSDLAADVAETLKNA